MNLSNIFDVADPQDSLRALFEALDTGLKESALTEEFTAQFQKWLSEDVRRRMRPWPGMCAQYLTLTNGCAPLHNDYEWEEYGPFLLLGFTYRDATMIFFRLRTTVEVDPFPQHNAPTVLEVKIPQ